MPKSGPRRVCHERIRLFDGVIRSEQVDRILKGVDNPIFGLPNVVVSPHVAGVTIQATRATATQVAGEMLRVLRGERPDVLVNPDVWPRLRQP
jgi:phosphoglycerate dehydrogenase-like enzyme